MTVMEYCNTRVVCWIVSEHAHATQVVLVWSKRPLMGFAPGVHFRIGFTRDW